MDIPDEILSIIIEFVDFKEKDWLNIRLTCKTFLRIAKKVQDPSIEMNKALLFAIKNNYIDLIDELLKDKRVKEKINNHKNSILINAILDRKLEIVRLLLKNIEFDINYEEGSLFYFTPHFSQEITREFLKIESLKPSLKGNKLIENLSRYGYIETIKEVMKHKNYDNRLDEHGIIATACIRNDTQYIKDLIELGFNPSACNNEAVCNAVQFGYTNILKLLLRDKRVNPNDQDYKALKLAFLNRKRKFVKLLLKYRGIDLVFRNTYVLKNACLVGYLDVVKYLLRDPNIDPSVNNNDAIIAACVQGRAKILKYLRNRNDPRIDFSYPSNKPLITACKHMNVMAVKEILKDPRVDPSVDNNKPLIMSIKMGFSIFKTLIKDKRINLYKGDSNILDTAIHDTRLKHFEILLSYKTLDPSISRNKILDKVRSLGLYEHEALLLRDPRVLATEETKPDLEPLKKKRRFF